MTSARPPVLANGAASEAARASFMTNGFQMWDNRIKKMDKE
jgi:hypothetical protein